MQALVLLLAVTVGSSPGVRRELLFISDQGQAVFELDAGAPVGNTDTVLVDGRMLTSGEEYWLTQGGRLLVLARPVERWSTIRVVYHSIGGKPVVAPRTRLAGPAREAGGPPESARPVVAAPDTANAGPGLDVSGSKSVGFTLGGVEGSGLNQSTRLKINGEVEGVDIEAELSDQGSPIPAEGTTRELDELDRIAIALRGREWSGQFGDVSLSLSQAGFGQVQRRAVGGLAEARLGSIQARVGYARPRGESDRVSFRGSDGVQGPYRLAPGGGQAPVVPGTERVWLDGEPLVRGWDADYTIDYATGELRFTGRRIITGATRVEAVCQFRRDAWLREDLVGGATFLPGGVELAVDYLRESDDPARSLGLELDEGDREYLASIGGDTARAWLDGGTPVEPGTGPYVLDPGGFYRYVGEDSGDFRVAFSYVGDSLGDYVYDDTLLFHRHVGDSLGDYVARVKVELPERREWVAGRAAYERGSFQAVLSGTWLRRDHNLLAPGGAAAGDGTAGAGMEWQSGPVRLNYGGAWRTGGVEFGGGDSAIGFRERWGGLEPEDAVVRNEVAASFRPADQFEAGVEAGLLATTGGEQVPRLAGTVRAGFARLSAGRAGGETRLRTVLDPRFGRFEPRAGVRFEGTDSVRETRVEAGLDVPVNDELRAGAGAEYDVGSLADTRGWLADSRGWLGRAEFSWRRDERVDVRARVGRQERDLPGRQDDDWVRWFGNLRAVVLPLAGVRLQADLDQSNGLVQSKDELFRYVGEGNGGYRRDSTSGRYYADPGGDFERLVVARDEYQSARERAANLGVELAAWEPFGITGSFSGSETGSDSGTAMSNWSATGRLNLRAFEPGLEPQFGVDAGQSEDRTLSATGQRVMRFRVFGEVASRDRPGLAVVGRVERRTDRRYRGTGVDLEETGWAAVLEPTIGSRLRLEMSLDYGNSLIAAPLLYPELGEFRLQSAGARAARSFSLAGRTRIRPELAVVYRWSAVDELPFEVALGRPLGILPTAGLSISHVMSDILTASFGYRFSDRPDRAAEHSLTGEVRAFF